MRTRQIRKIVASCVEYTFKTMATADGYAPHLVKVLLGREVAGWVTPVSSTGGLPETVRTAARDFLKSVREDIGSGQRGRKAALEKTKKPARATKPTALSAAKGSRSKGKKAASSARKLPAKRGNSTRGKRRTK